MITISWGSFVALATLIVAIGPGFYWLGRTAKQVDVNTESITAVKGQIAEIYLFVRNGRQQKGV